jgi:tRNA pseudouridine55 synthase
MPISGLFNVNKPPGRTSRDVVDSLERLTAPSRAGHAGTLDPLASGVLVICVGQATRLIQYVQRMPKKYRAAFLLGRRSETDDVEGDVQVLADAPIPSRAMLLDVLPQFLGEIQQRPPAHSAIKVGGRRAYRLARAGATVELGPRPVMIHSIEIRRYEHPDLELDVECGSGTYIRALGRDLAAALGTAAVMSALERTAIGGFRIDNAVPLNELRGETLAAHLQPPLAAVTDLPRLTLAAPETIALRHGRPIPKSILGTQSFHASGEMVAVDEGGELVAIVREKRPGELWPGKTFNCA